MTFTKKRDSKLIRMVSMHVDGFPCWHYVRISKTKASLLRPWKKVDLGTMGEVVASGWGRNPPLDIQREIEARYG